MTVGVGFFHTVKTMDAISLKEFTDRIAGAVNLSPGLRDVWVTGETSDLRRTGHCYLELVHKNPRTGEPEARLRCTIWRNVLARIDADFMAATGQYLASGMKVMVRVTASFHPAYGLSGNITGIEPAYTLGDLMRLRKEIIDRLKREGILTLNRELPWPEPALRVAVVSAEGAAGYGDFIHQLYSTPRRIRFTTKLFGATMQGTSAPGSIISALEQVAAEEEDWDCVVVIRGGGATADLAAFENYDLAANIAQFPLPVVIGIGHERDETVLDRVANVRVKTPTAAAELLIERATAQLERVEALAGAIHMRASGILAGCREQLAYISATLPLLPRKALEHAGARLENSRAVLTGVGLNRILPEKTRLTHMAQVLETSSAALIERRRMRLSSIEELIAVLSPQATLARGYSITRFEGKAVSSAEDLPAGAEIVTTLARGEVRSTVKNML